MEALRGDDMPLQPDSINPTRALEDAGVAKRPRRGTRDAASVGPEVFADLSGSELGNPGGSDASLSAADLDLEA
eukprot:3477501-Lingulodinium_polyedra.AAC.1